MPEKRSRIFSRGFKLDAISRMAAGENVSALSRELEVRRKLLYEWRDAWRIGGEAALRSPGRPRKGVAVVGAKGSGRGSRAELAPVGGQAELAAARRRIAELERKIGQQALEADFFRQALRQVETLRQPSDRPGATAALDAIRKHERTGRPLGSEAFLEGLEARLGRGLKRGPPGPKSRKTAADGGR